MATQPKRPKSKSTKPILDQLKVRQSQMKLPARRAVAPKVSASQRALVAGSPLSPAQSARLKAMRAQFRATFGH